jgi:hypothetical protein
MSKNTLPVRASLTLVQPSRRHVYVVRWQVDEEGWYSIPVIAWSMEEARSIANIVAGGNFTWVYRV